MRLASKEADSIFREKLRLVLPSIYLYTFMLFVGKKYPQIDCGADLLYSFEKKKNPG